jgi:uncharacterized protein
MKRSLEIIVLGSILFATSCSNVEAKRSEQPNDATVPSASAPAIPLAGRVTDAAHILSPAEQSKLAAKLELLEHATQHQMVIVTAPMLGGRDVTDFTKDLANRWGIGRKGYNDGVVLLVAPNERKVRIAVGYGLEARLTHATCQQIIDDQMLPHFRRGDLPGGIEAGTDALIARLR